MISLEFVFPASSNKRSWNCSFRKPGLAMMTHLRFSIMMFFINAWTTMEKKRFILLSCCELDPFRFLAIWRSILDLTTVIVEVSRQMCARPSWRITAATSAECPGSVHWFKRSRSIESHTSFVKVNFRLISISNVWYAPSLTCSFSWIFCPGTRKYYRRNIRQNQRYPSDEEYRR